MLARRKPARAAARGFFLIEAMVAILIFALGILGLVAMGGTAVSSQSDAQYRTEASALADAIAGEIAINLDRTDETTKAPSLAFFNHHATGASTDCNFTGAATGIASVADLANRAGNATALPGLPGATTAQQQVKVDPAPANFNRVEITLCWKAPSDTAMRRHTLVTYIN